MNNEDFFGEPIYTYTRKQAIADGVLADLSGNEVVKGHWRYPLACTSAVWSVIATAIREEGNDLNGILHDISVLAKLRMRERAGKDENEVRFTVIIGKATCELKLHIGPGDDPEPVLTLMFTDED